MSLLTYFKNTAIIALAVTFLQTLTSSFAAYAFAKLRFKGRDLLFVAYTNDCCAVAGVHAAAVHHDALDGAV